MSRSFNSSRHFSIQGESRDVCLDSLLVFPALDNHVIYGGKLWQATLDKSGRDFSVQVEIFYSS